MKTARMRLGVYGLGAVLVLGAAAAIVIAIIAITDKDDKTTDTPVSNVISASDKKACSIFTLADAKQLLGDNAKGGQSDSEQSSAALSVSDCAYTQDSGSNAPVSSANMAALAVRAPTTTIGSTSNQTEFNSLRPSDAQPVSDYGDAAYWEPTAGQLNILKNSIWYILSFGPVTPGDRTLGQTEQLADLLVDKL